VAPGTSGTADEEAVASRATTERQAMDAAVKKAVDDAVADKRATANKMAADEAAEEKVATDAVAAEGATLVAVTRGATESFPAPAAGAKRVAVSGGSTPPAKHQFRGSWKPRYAVGHCICPSFLYVYLVSLGFFIMQCVSFQQDPYPWS
jgi:hypothetical protein